MTNITSPASITHSHEPSCSTEPEWAERIDRCHATGMAIAYKVPHKSWHRQRFEDRLEKMDRNLNRRPSSDSMETVETFPIRAPKHQSFLSKLCRAICGS